MTTVSGFSWRWVAIRIHRRCLGRRDIYWMICRIVRWVKRRMLWVFIAIYGYMVGIRSEACWRWSCGSIIVARIECTSRDVRRRRTIAFIIGMTCIVVVNRRRLFFIACVMLDYGLKR
jgi:exosortase/archaeosortase